MATAFHRTASDRFSARFEESERALLRSLAEQLIDLVAPPEPLDPDADPLARLVGLHPDSGDEPTDPALARLLPGAYRDDREAAAEFRRFTERSLREGKVAHARSVLATLDRSGEKVLLGQEEAASWLMALNDMRLALGTRLGVTEAEESDEADAREDLENLEDVADGEDVDDVHDERADHHDDLDEDDEDVMRDPVAAARAAMRDLYDWLTWLQDSLVRALSRTMT